MIYDVIVVGLGPGGISAAIYAKRSGLNVMVLEGNMPGGLLNYTNVVNNYPGFINISGPDLSMKMYEHFLTFDIDYKNEDVKEIVYGEVKKVVTEKGEYEAHNVIIATGRSRRSLNLPKEEELRGNGISYCAMCDGHFYKDKDVLVVGSGDSSLEESLYLSNIVNKVTIIVRGDKLGGNKDLKEKVEDKDNIEVKFKSSIESLKENDGKFTGVVLNDKTELDASALFVYIGFEPILPFKCNEEMKREDGYIIVDKNFETNLEGIYAVGDIIKKDLYQIISAVHEGASAATAIVRKLTKKN
ncbi:MAG: NAD(P)/FAD-dependent oxidoreductase [Bacilli bacterium]|nr:NAD(P)/FAD-dependent oxidoreductase [Bacilli bacterium]